MTDFSTWNRKTLEQFAQEAAAENAELREQNRELLADWRKLVAQSGTNKQLEVEQASNAILALEVEGLRADAARYRWLRQGDNDELVLCNGPVDKSYWYLPRLGKLDAAIDAAMKETTS